jgi:pyruvate,water dikinase
LRFFFRELIRLTRTYTILDDLEHYQTTRINPLAYRAAHALGGHLRTLGVLDDPGDVFYLHKADQEALVEKPEKANIERCRQACQVNKGSFQKALETTPPWSLAEKAVAAVADSSSVLRGLPGSPGRATGPCFVVHGPEDFRRFPKGAVLVARTTNPAWTALFYAASAIVTESGGPLSHGAVTAREMGLPAVMSARGVMTRLKEGQQVVVDGSQGTVELP